MAKLGARYFFVVIFDGASNMQSAGRILMAGNPQLTLVHCALHVVHLMFGQIALIAQVAALIANYRVLRNWVYAHHFNFDLYTDLVKKANGGKFVGLPEAADTRMGGHFMCLFRALRLRNVLIQLVTHEKYVEQRYAEDPIRDFVMKDDTWHQIYSLLRAVWPLIPLLRLGDTNDATMGFQYKYANMTKERMTKAVDSDTTPFMLEVGPQLLEAFGHYEEELTHDFSKAAYLLNPAFVDEAKVLIQSDPGLLPALEVIAGRMLSGLPEGERHPAVEEVVEAVMDMQNKSGPYNRPAAWASGKAKSAPHEWHAAWSTGHVRRVGMAVLSKPTGAGGPERNWADVKAVFDKKKASTLPERVEKKTLIYGMSRRDPTLSGKMSSSLKDAAWTEEDEVWDGLGRDKWAYAETSALRLYATSRRFYNYLEDAHTDVINNQKVENGATLVAKYKGIRFFDADIEGGTYYRIRSDHFTWAGKRAGGWLATCDEMPSSDPSEDPADDKGRSVEYDPEVYVINVELHRMIGEADQAADIIMEAADEEEEEE